MPRLKLSHYYSLLVCSEHVRLTVDGSEIRRSPVNMQGYAIIDIWKSQVVQSCGGWATQFKEYALSSWILLPQKNWVDNMPTNTHSMNIPTPTFLLPLLKTNIFPRTVRHSKKWKSRLPGGHGEVQAMRKSLGRRLRVGFFTAVNVLFPFSAVLLTSFFSSAHKGSAPRRSSGCFTVPSVFMWAAIKTFVTFHYTGLSIGIL